MSVKDIIMGAAGAASSGGYEIQRSLRFNSADSAYLNRTPASAGNRTTWTWSGWVKRSTLGSNQAFFAGNAAANDSDYLGINFLSDDALSIEGWTSVWRKTTQVFRDVSAWYHIVVVWDTTQATAANRIKLYVNNVEVTSFITSVNPSLNATSGVNTAAPHYISTYNTVNQFINCYLTEINFIDGQALTPSSFGAFDAQTGVWGPTRYAGSYGTNGFYLNFSDNSNTTAATLGRDYSGNGNNWTPNNFSVSAGAGNDSLVDVPTNWGTDTGVGGTVRGNYCTWNPLALGVSGALANGNLDISYVAAARTATGSTFGMLSGKWYWEVTVTASSNATATSMIGLTSNSTANSFSYPGATSTSWGYYGADGTKYVSASGSAYGATYAVNDVIGVAFDADAGTLTFYKNNTSQGTAFSSLTSGPYFPAIGNGTSAHSFSAATNFGQRPFAYTAPSGFKALNTQNLPTPTIGATTATQAGKFFNTITWTGNDVADRTFTGVGFQPDFVWAKSRSQAYSHLQYDVLRGAGSNTELSSNQTVAEGGTNADTFGYLAAFASDGFTTSNSYPNLYFNANGDTYVAWNWKANGAGVTNTAGSITSTVSANTTSGFSVVTYTGNATAGATVGHGLGVAPSMIMVKCRSTVNSWAVYHRSLGNNYVIYLNITNAANGPTSAFWNNTSPTSNVFTLGSTGTEVNSSGATYVAYCFAEVPGYSRFGSYTGNGSTDGPFVFCGFRPAYVMIKRTDAVSSWEIHDTKRAPYNADDKALYANLSDAEATYVVLDELSNGFKLRTNLNGTNQSNGTYIFMAFAEAPQKFALAR